MKRGKQASRTWLKLRDVLLAHPGWYRDRSDGGVKTHLEAIRDEKRRRSARARWREDTTGGDDHFIEVDGSAELLWLGPLRADVPLREQFEELCGWWPEPVSAAWAVTRSGLYVPRAS